MCVFRICVNARLYHKIDTITPSNNNFITTALSERERERERGIERRQESEREKRADLIYTIYLFNLQFVQRLMDDTSSWENYYQKFSATKKCEF